jgi:hypothetical protein
MRRLIAFVGAVLVIFLCWFIWHSTGRKTSDSGRLPQASAGSKATTPKTKDAPPAPFIPKKIAWDFIATPADGGEGDVLKKAQALRKTDILECRKLVKKCFSDEATRQKLSPEKLAALASLCWVDDNQEPDEHSLVAKDLEPVEKALQKKNEEAPLLYMNHRDMALSLRSVVEDARAMDWGQRAFDAMLGGREYSGEREAPAERRGSLDMLRDLARLLQATHLSARSEQVGVQFAQALVELSERGPLDLARTDAPLFAPIIKSNDARRVLSAKVVQANDRPNLAIAEVLTWASRKSSDLAVWKKFVEERIEKNKGDTKALWLVVCGHIEVVRITPVEPARRLRWITQAESVAESEAVRAAIAKQRM